MRRETDRATPCWCLTGTLGLGHPKLPFLCLLSWPAVSSLSLLRKCQVHSSHASAPHLAVIQSAASAVGSAFKIADWMLSVKEREDSKRLGPSSDRMHFPCAEMKKTVAETQLRRKMSFVLDFWGVHSTSYERCEISSYESEGIYDGDVK